MLEMVLDSKLFSVCFQYICVEMYIAKERIELFFIWFDARSSTAVAATSIACCLKVATGADTIDERSLLGSPDASSGTT
jgi:hypothetical protein